MRALGCHISDSLDWMERQDMFTPHRPRLLSETPYSVPRRYDLATLFFVTTAYALLFAALRLIRLPPRAVGTIALLLALVGIAQAVLFKGKAPRAASITVGTIFVGIVYVMAIPGPMSIEDLTPLLLSSALLGPVVGYLCGVLVGGVFLVADVARKLVARLSARRHVLAAQQKFPPGDLDGQESRSFGP
jgi:hypothetical protein